VKPNFQKDLKRGQASEAHFLTLFTGLKGTDGRKGDLLAPNGTKIELKTDFYDIKKTANYFMERYSSVETGSPGGPWQAQANNCTYFVYYYSISQTGFIFTTNELIAQLEPLEQQKRIKAAEVRNIRWTTVGYKVPRYLLEPIAEFNADSLTILKPELAAELEAWQFKPVL
jgi:hypothetical protein